MQINAFRIRNFRSILDTEWVPLSLDNVTALVGQNESGKSAILDALAVTFSSSSVTTDDQRHDEPLPIIDLRVTHSPQELEKALEKLADEGLRAAISLVFKDRQYRAEWNFETCPDPDDRTQLSVSYELAAPALAGLIEEEITGQQQAKAGSQTEEDPHSAPTGQAATAASAPRPTTAAAAATPANTPAATAAPPQASATQIFDSFRDALFQASPTIIAFDEQSGLLPDRADITKDFKLAGPGAQAAHNFLYIAGIDLKQLVESDQRARATILKKANRKVTEDFLAFWRQTIGKESSLELECSIHHYPSGNEKVGETHLEFLIIDNATPLYPKQRSRGTRWFISFFLQLQASAVRGRNRIFLLDEPGSNLHERAQADVLDLIEKIRPTIGIIYSTHSPHLISYQRLHRILAVERDPTTPGHPTRVIGAHALGAASTDTLSPILTTMGVALSRQSAVQRHNNVILEELSAYYYLRAFWLLTKEQQVAHFLAGNGTSNVAQLAQLFLGWGLDFVVVIDDEPSGRAVYNTLKRDMFLDDPCWAGARMLKIAGCDGIEDVFTTPTTRISFSMPLILCLRAAKGRTRNGRKRMAPRKPFMH